MSRLSRVLPMTLPFSSPYFRICQNKDVLGFEVKYEPPGGVNPERLRSSPRRGRSSQGSEVTTLAAFTEAIN